MALGPGKYDTDAEALRIILEAKGLVLIVMEGVSGSGVSGKVISGFEDKMPAFLREIANEMENDNKQAKGR